MLVEGCDLEAAEPYGECLTFGPGHYEVWERWRHACPPNRALTSLVRECEYEEWPRGRVVLDRAADRFVLYADRRITAASLTGEVVKRFCLPSDRVVVRHDLHYQSPRAIGVRVATRR